MEILDTSLLGQAFLLKSFLLAKLHLTYCEPRSSGILGTLELHIFLVTQSFPSNPTVQYIQGRVPVTTESLEGERRKGVLAAGFITARRGFTRASLCVYL